MRLEIQSESDTEIRIILPNGEPFTFSGGDYASLRLDCKSNKLVFEGIRRGDGLDNAFQSDRPGVGEAFKVASKRLFQSIQYAIDTAEELAPDTRDFIQKDLRAAVLKASKEALGGRPQKKAVILSSAPITAKSTAVLDIDLSVEGLERAEAHVKRQITHYQSLTRR